MPALCTGACVVGHFIGWQSALLTNFLGHFEHRSGEVVGRNDQLALPGESRESRARFDGKLIKRQVFGSKCQGSAEPWHLEPNTCRFINLPSNLARLSRLSPGKANWSFRPTTSPLRCSK